MIDLTVPGKMILDAKKKDTRYLLGAWLYHMHHGRIKMQKKNTAVLE